METEKQSENKTGGRLIVCFDDKAKNKSPITFEAPDEHRLKALNEKGFGIFETANSFFATEEQLKESGFKTKRHKEFLIRLNEVFADLDICKDNDGLPEQEREQRKNALKAAIDTYCPASIYVITKNGLQPRWWIDELSVDEVTQQKYVDITNGIIEWSKKNGAKGDPVKDVTRVLRKAGYYHHKSTPYLVMEEEGNGKKYTLEELKSFFWYESKNKPPESPALLEKSPISIKIDDLEIKNVVIDIWKEKGQVATFDKDNHLIIDGEKTATFVNRDGKNFVATSSSDYPAKGNAITYVAETLGISTKDAFQWLCKKYDLNGNANLKEDFGVVTAEELCNQELPEVEWIAHRMIPENQITIISGAPSSFKTMSAMELAIKVTSGGKVYGYFETTRCPVLIINEDGDHKRVMKKRILFLTEKPDKNLYIITNSGFKVEEHQIKKLVEVVKRLKIKFIILDSLRAIMPQGADEKDAGTVRQIINHLKALTDIGATILIVHHDRKKAVGIRGYTSTDLNDLGEMMSGSADIRGASDCHLAMGSAKDKREGKHFIIITQTKCREEELLPAFKIVVNTTKDAAQKTIKMELRYDGEYKADSAEETMVKARAAILDFIFKSTDPYVGRKIIIESKIGGFGQRTLDGALKSLISDSTLDAKNGSELGKGGSGANSKYYFIPNEEIENAESSESETENNGLF